MAAATPEVAAPAKVETEIDFSGEMVFSACICCYAAFDCKNILVGLKNDSSCLCLENKCCIAANMPMYPVGLVPDEGMVCKLGLPCCTLGLKNNVNPLCLGDSQCLCCKEKASLPFVKEVVPGPICVVYGLQCTPNCGCCQPPVKKGGAPATTVDDAEKGVAMEAMER
mmetsp:Transcript_4622/g.9916  ORF Transcript_4622/g.9916 Transcript_4622/m.9916 type:complete len:168 (-) Transcript_4622:216-719(-)|eukprot:CAMPEP_0182564816 /NCGR_PEP_ID=MMETSP1324-20130603/6680_1 /TAXON_ID=236786 /ORGANISM="Florenciella sp., Strain RCC1587" /LENGTH=167 /DNA_ID=CAMNT_0024778357 /DNA_START=106 /DNA_END=609 /DNA_ORIENTATION=+